VLRSIFQARAAVTVIHYTLRAMHPPLHKTIPARARRDLTSTLSAVTLVLAGMAASSSFAAAKPAQPTSPPKPALADLLACHATMKDWFAFAMAYQEPGAVEAWGWKSAKVGDGFLQVFVLREPLKVFSERISRIAFSGSGVVALLEHKTLQQLARDLKLEPVSNSPSTQIFAKTLQSETVRSGDMTTTTRISLSASTSASYPGVVLAGCSYEVGFRHPK
jgi:hypothetical protein